MVDQEERGGASGGSGEPFPGRLFGAAIRAARIAGNATGRQTDAVRGRTVCGRGEPVSAVSGGVSHTARNTRASPAVSAPAQQHFSVPGVSWAPQEIQAHEATPVAGGVTAVNTEVAACTRGGTGGATRSDAVSVPQKNRSTIAAIPMKETL